MRAATAWALASTVGLHAKPAFAQTQPVASPAPHAAEALVAQGVDARRNGADARALQLFQQAHAIDHEPRSLAQMGLAEQALGQWRDADGHLREAMSAAADPWIVSHRESLMMSIESVDRHLGSLDVVSATPHAELYVNGERIGALPLAEPVRLPLGSTVLSLRAPGYRTAERTVELVAATLTRETFTLVPDESRRASVESQHADAASSSPPPVVIAPHRGGGSAAPFIVAGAGVVSLGAAGVFFGLRQSALGPCRVDPDAIRCPTPMDVTHASNAGTWNSASDVALVAGGVLVAAGVAWWIIDRATHHEERAETRMTFQVAPRGDGAWVGLGGRL